MKITRGRKWKRKTITFWDWLV